MQNYSATVGASSNDVLIRISYVDECSNLGLKEKREKIIPLDLKRLCVCLNVPPAFIMLSYRLRPRLLLHQRLGTQSESHINSHFSFSGLVEKFASIKCTVPMAECYSCIPG